MLPRLKSLALSTGILIAAIKDYSTLQSRHVVRVLKESLLCLLWLLVRFRL